MPIRQKPAVERRSEPRTTILQTGLIDEMVMALLAIGGSAHRDSVIVRVAARRGLPAVPDRLRRDLLNAFDLHRARTGQPERLLWLPFGEGSRRWALTPEDGHPDDVLARPVDLRDHRVGLRDAVPAAAGDGVP